MYVSVCIDSEGAGNRIDARHLSECQSHDRGQNGGDQVRQDDARAGQSDSCAASQEETHSDGPADGDHRELPGVQSALEALFLFRVAIGFCHGSTSAPSQELAQIIFAYPWSQWRVTGDSSIRDPLVLAAALG